MQEENLNEADLTNFDEVPIGGNTNFAISEYANKQQANFLQEYSNMTFGQKIRSKTIKVKLEGLEELRNKLTEDPQAEITEQDDQPFEISKIIK